MTISFSGLASGLDTSSWVESLVALKQAKVETLETEKEDVLSLQETLSSIKSFFSSFRSMLEKVTDAKFGVASMDLFAQNLATSSNLDVLTASATTEAEEGTYDVLVDQLASETQAVSNYSYMTTIIQTTTATGDSKLINLGVKAGNIGVNVNGVERGITITENDTISTFIEKLKNIGVEASFNEETGIFSINVDDDDINDIDGTGIVDALHLEGVNEGYTSNSLQTSKTDTVFSAATESTLLSELGVNAGVITVEANDTSYNITIYDTSTLGTFITDLRACNIDATLDSNGIFTISDAEITSEGATNILDALGLTADVSEKSQITGDLTHMTIVTQTTTATSSTLLRDINGGTAIANGQTVIVRNSNNEYTTITVGTTTTIGELLQDMSNAGLYAAINNDGTVEITGGTITGGTFDAVEALGLEKEPYSAMVTGDALTETVEVRNPVTLETRLVDDLKVTEGYLEVTDADGNKEYLKIYSGQTIADLMTALANYGLSTDLDEETGILSITGGAFKTLTDTDVQALVNDGTIRETDSRYIHGTNLLECLYGAGTISTDHITVASTYSKTQALSHSVINTINASLTTTLGDLGLNAGTAVFDVRGENRTINVTAGMTIEELMEALANQGIASSWDNEHSKITIENSTLAGGTSNLADVLNLTETISGKYTTSDQLYARETLTIDATRDTVLADYGITNSMSTADRTVNLYDSDGNLVASTVVGEGTTIGNLLDFINNQTDISASLQNGILTIHNGYIENSALETAMGLETSNKSSYVLGSQMTVTTTAAVTGETTLGSIISTLGTTDKVAGGYNLNFNGTDLAVSADTTINELINMIYDNGGTASLDNTGRLSVNGGTLTGSVAEALGIKSVTHTSSVSASGETLFTEEEVYADRDTTLAELGINDSSYVINDNLGNALTTINVSGTTTLGTFLDTLKANGIDGVIANGVISLESLEGKYITGALANALGITVNTTTDVVNTSQSSTAPVTHTGTVTADITTTLGQIGAVTAGGGEELLIYNSDQVCIATISSLTTSSTIGDLFDVLGAYGIQGSIINGVISLYSESGSYAAGEIMDNLGITVESGINTTFTIGQTITSSDRITYTDNTVATEDSLMLGLMPGSLSSLVVDVRHYEPDGSISSIGSITITNSTTIGDFFDQLKQYQINGSIDDGVITLTSEEGNGVFHTYLQIYLGFDIHEVNVTITTGATSTSTTAITFTEVQEMTTETKLSDIGITGDFISPVERLTEDEARAQGYTVVKTVGDLLNMTSSGKYILMNDIDMSSVSDWTTANRMQYVFVGTFNGNGYTISNVNITSAKSGYAGFFGRLQNASISNLKLEGVNIFINGSTGAMVGGLAGAAFSTTSISNVVIEDLVMNVNQGSSIGGLVGSVTSANADISDSYVTGTIAGTNVQNIGGFVGGMSAGVISDSWSATTLRNAFSGVGSGYYSTGGFIGTMAGTGRIVNSYTTSTFLSMAASAYSNGVVVGNYQSGSIDVAYDPNLSAISAVGPASASTPALTTADMTNKALGGLWVMSGDGEEVAQINVNGDMTVGDILNSLSAYGIAGKVENGIITLSSTNGNYVAGTVADALGIGAVETTVTKTVGTTVTSTAPITYTEVTTATRDTQIGDLITTYKIDGTITASGVTGTIIGISTAQELEWLADAVNRGNSMRGKTIVLTNNIDMSGITDWTPIGDYYMFQGTFDGQGHTISNLTMTTLNPSSTSGQEVMGLFGIVANATIKNVNLNNFTISVAGTEGDDILFPAASFLVAQVDYRYGVNISGITVANSFIDSGGGIIGECDGYATITDCFTQFTAMSQDNTNVYCVGGIVQLAEKDITIKGCSSSFTASGNYYLAGGIAGRISLRNTSQNIIEDCAYTGNIRSTRSNTMCGIGGIVGHANNDINGSASNLTINRVYSSATLSSAINPQRVAGIVSIDRDATGTWDGTSNNTVNITDAYSSGSYQSYYLAQADYATVSTSNVQNNTSVSQFATIAAQRGFSPVDWDYASGLTTNVFAGPYQLIVKDKNGKQLYSSANQWDENTTLGEVMDVLKKYGDVTLIDGVLTFKGTDGNFITGLFAEDLGIETVETTTNKTVGTTATSTAAITYTEVTTATKDTTVGDLLHTYKIDGTITASGVTGNVIGISTAQDLVNLATLVNNGNTMNGKTFVLTDDIDLAGIAWKCIGYDYSHAFEGNFDGQGHVISHLTQVYDPSIDGTMGGLFGKVGGSYGASKIKNITFEGVTIRATTTSTDILAANIGVLAGEYWGGEVSNITVRNFCITVDGSNNLGCKLGGIIGYGVTNITNCQTSGRIDAQDESVNAGGLVGLYGYGTPYTISQSHSSVYFANIGTGGAGPSYVGGIVGLMDVNPDINYRFTVQDCSFSGYFETITDDSISAGIVGAIGGSGRTTLNITNCLTQSSSNMKSACFVGMQSNTTSTDSINISNTFVMGGATGKPMVGSGVAQVALNNSGETSNYYQSAMTSGLDMTIRQENGCIITSSEINKLELVKDGLVMRSYTFGDNDTIQDIIDFLDDYGDVTFSDGRLTFEGYDGYWLTGGLADVLGINVTSQISTITVGKTVVSGSSITHTADGTIATNSSTLYDIQALNIYDTGTMRVMKNNELYTITLTSSTTIGDMLLYLHDYGIEGSLINGTLTIAGTEDAYIYSMNSSVAQSLKLPGYGPSTFTTSAVVTTYANTVSRELSQSSLATATTSTTLDKIVGHYKYIYDASSGQYVEQEVPIFGVIGGNPTLYITVVSDGTEHVLKFDIDQTTIGDVFNALGSYGIKGSIYNGLVTFESSEDVYINTNAMTMIRPGLIYSDDFYRAFNLVHNSTRTAISQTTVTNDESDVLRSSAVVTATGSTTLGEAFGEDWGAEGSMFAGVDTFIEVVQNGVSHTIYFDATTTINELFNELASYGISAQLEQPEITGYPKGIAIISGSENAYINISEYITEMKDLGAWILSGALRLPQNFMTTTTDTTYTNDESDHFVSTITGELTTSTLFSELNVGADGYVTVNSNGTEYIVTVTPDMSVDDLISTLAGFGISGSVKDGKLTFVGTENGYITGMSTNIQNALALQVGDGYTYEMTEEWHITITSDELTEEIANTLSTSTTFDDLGITGNNYITVVSNGTEHIITITPEMTVDDMISTIAGFGISGSVIDGKLTFSADVDSYIKDMSQDLKDALKLEAGDGNSWTTVEGATWVNSDSNDLTVEKDDMIITGDTVLSTIDGFTGGNLIVHQADGRFVTINVDATGTLDDFFKQIADYGLVGSVDSEGRVTVTGVGNVYLQAASGGSNILTSLNMSNVIYNVQTIRSNSTSDTLSHTIQVAASGSTTLDDLALSSGDEITFNGAGNVSLVLETTSDAGNQHITLTFSRTSSLYDVIDKLAEYGINASVDAMGRFSITSSTLTDFDISGELGDFLMGAYHKEYGEDTTYNVSTNLVQETIVNMKDSDLLSQFGVTGGNILITQQGVNYTVNVDMTNIVTVGDFRNLLSQYGFTTSIDDHGRLSVSGVGESYLSSIAGGSNILDVFGLTDWTLGEITQQSDHLTDTEVIVHAITMQDKISELTDAAGNNLGITAGQIYVYQDGTRSTLNIDTNDTLETLAAKLSQYGITLGISQEGRIYFDGNNNSYLTTDGLSSANASNILEKIGAAGDWETRYDSTSAILDYTEKVNNVVTGSTKLSDLQDAAGNNLGITEGTYYVYSNGVRNTETITADMTVNDLMATLAYYGLVADIDENGSISVGAYNNTYLATSALAGQNSNIVSTLFAEWDFVNIYTSNGLDVPQDVIEAIDRDTKLSDINEGTYQDGYITVVKDGIQTNISLTADDTVGTLMDELALYGFESVINENGQLIIKNTGNSLLQNYTGPEKASNVLDLLGIGLNDWISTDSYKSSTINVVQTSTLDVSATRDTLMSELGVSTGEYYVYNNGVRYTALISSDETLGSFMDTLASFGLETSLVDGPNGAVLSIVGKGDSYIAKSTSTTNASNVVDVLFNNAQPSEKYEYKGLEQTSEIVTTYSAATEETLLSYFDNGLLLAEGDLSVTVNGQTSIIKIGADETFGSLLQKFRDLGLEATLNNGQIMIQSGFDTFTINTNGTTSNLMATVGLVYHDDLGGYGASSDTVKATTTNIEEKTLSVSNYADLSTQMGLLNISDGSLTVYRDGEKATIQINSNETFGDLRTRLSTAFSDLELAFEDGYLSIYSKDGRSVEVGSTTDTSNFSAITGIAKQEDGASRSARELYCVNSDSVVTASGLFRRGNVTEGTFYVGDAMFTVTSTTTLANLISQINSSDEANATAYWDNIDGKFVIKSRTTGSALVNIEAGTSNFTDIMGYTTSEWNADGSLDVTRMNVDTQEIGDNAKVTINGTSYTSTSNTITSDISRIKGLTINLKGLTEGSAVTLTVERDKETLANAISDVVDSYNELMKNVDESIAVGGDLHDETTLKLIRNQLRSIMTSSDIGTTIFKNLDSIGISVDSASANNISTSNESIISLTFDKDKFIQAYEADQDAVKDLLIGGDTNTGIFTKAEQLVESALQSVTGYFDSADRSFDREISRLDDKITKANQEVERYRERLEAKFSAMDLLIAQMQQQYSTFLTT